MSGLISDLLTLAGADSHSLPSGLASCEPDTLLLDTFEAFELLAREKGYHLSIQLPEEKNNTRLLRQRSHPSGVVCFTS